jgi:hypothetical protein
MLPATLLTDRSLPFPVRPSGRYGWQGRSGSKGGQGPARGGNRRPVQVVSFFSRPLRLASCSYFKGVTTPAAAPLGNRALINQ